jgi:DNA-directed RNA polymerase subunit RPC12/RpoP
MRQVPIFELEIERENGDRDTLYLCVDCKNTTSDFARVLKTRRSMSRCDRCEASALATRGPK